MTEAIGQLLEADGVEHVELDVDTFSNADEIESKLLVEYPSPCSKLKRAPLELGPLWVKF